MLFAFRNFMLQFFEILICQRLKNLAASDNDLSDLVYEPPRNGPTLWEIGVPDRSAAEFYVPDPNPMYINKLYVNHTDRYY